MKILFLNPPAENTIKEYPDESGDSYLETEDFGHFPPLGLLYVLSYLEKHTSGHDIYFKDCVAEQISHKELTRIFSNIRPDVIGMTSFTISLVDICRAARTARDCVPHAHICLGGHHPIAFPYLAAELDDIDSIVVGEGEVAFTELVKALDKQDDITGIQGVYTAESIAGMKGKPYHDHRFLSNVMVPPAYIEDIDTLPFPNRARIQHINYQSVVGVTSKLATIISSRGCPYKCTFCDVPYKRYRKRSVSNVLDEVETCLRMGFREFHFYDDLFNITPQRVLDFCDEVEKRSLKFIWDFRGRVNTVTRESLERAKRAGCRLISFGVETGSDEGLRILKKNTSTAQIKKVFKWCQELGIKTLADFMIGLPSERTTTDVLQNIDFLIKLDPDYAQIAILCLYPNTELFDLAVEKGLIRPGKWESFALSPTTDFVIDHWEEFLNTRQLVALQKKGYQKYYFRIPYILRSVFSTRSVYEFKTKAKGFLKLIS